MIKLALYILVHVYDVSLSLLQLRFGHLLYSKPCLKPTLKKEIKIWGQDRLSVNAGQTYCRMLLEELSVILLTFIKLPFVIMIFELSILEWPLKTGLTVYNNRKRSALMCKLQSDN